MQNLQSMLMVFLASLLSNFGSSHFNSKIDKVNSYKLVIFIALLSGIVIWGYYQASLTSGLAIELKRYPFSDLHSFSQTNYR